MSPLWYDELGFVYIDAKIPLAICPIRADAAYCMRINIDSFTPSYHSILGGWEIVNALD